MAPRTNGPPAGANLFVSVYNDQQHFTYSDVGGNLHDSWNGTDGWHLQQLTEGSPSVPGEYVVPTPGPRATAGSLNVSVYNNQQHFAYIDVNGLVQDVWYGTDGWHLQQLTAKPGAVRGEYVVPTPGPPAHVPGGLFVSVYNNQQHFTYGDASGDLQDVWYGTDGWHLQQLTAKPAAVRGEYVVPTPGPPAHVPGGLFVSVYNNQQHFTYGDASGDLQDVWYGTDGWHLQQLTAKPAAVQGEYVVPTPGPPFQAGLAVSVYNNQQHFTYGDASGNLQDVWYGTDGWHLQQLTAKPTAVRGEYVVPTPGPLFKAGLAVCVYDNQQHFAYIDVNDRVQDVWYGTDGWHLQQLTTKPAAVRGEYVVPTPGPRAADAATLSVSVYNGQQHFAYIDASAFVQDVWYGTDGWHLQEINQGL